MARVGFVQIFRLAVSYYISSYCGPENILPHFAMYFHLPQGLLPSVTGLSSSKEITLFYLYFFGMKENLSSSTKGLRRRQNKYLFYLYILQLALIARAKYCLSYLSTHCIILLFFFFFWRSLEKLEFPSKCDVSNSYHDKL